MNGLLILGTRFGLGSNPGIHRLRFMLGATHLMECPNGDTGSKTRNIKAIECNTLVTYKVITACSLAIFLYYVLVLRIYLTKSIYEMLKLATIAIKKNTPLHASFLMQLEVLQCDTGEIPLHARTKDTQVGFEMEANSPLSNT